MPEFIPYTERPEFIPAHPKGERPGFERAAALFAYGDVDGMLVDYLAQHTPSPSPRLAEGAANA